MIGKKVANPQGGTGKAARASGLLDYVADPGGKEKCIHTYSDGFLSDELAVQIAEMTALAQEATRSADPINHYVLSWQEGEQPTPAQVDAAVQIFMKELGLQGHQVFAGLHADTDNLHLHIVVNRVHPDTLKPTRINNGFDIEAIHRAVAKIEQAQGWNREERGRYVVLEDGELMRDDLVSDIPGPAKPRQPHQARIDQENRTGAKSAERIAIEDAAPLIKAAASWSQLHAALAEQGIRYEKTGSGAKIYIGDIAIKASSADRSASLAQLEKRLGLYEPAVTHTVFIQHKITPHHERQNPAEQSPAIPRGHISHRPPDQPGRRFAPTGGTPTIATASLHTLSERRLAGRQQIQGRQGRPTRDPDLLPPAQRGDRRPDAGLRRLDRVPERLSAVSALVPAPARAIHPLAVDYLGAKAVAATGKRHDTLALQIRQGDERSALAELQRAERAGLFKGTGWSGAGEHRRALRSVLAGQHAGGKAAMQERHQLERAALRERHPVFADVESWYRQRGQVDTGMDTGMDRGLTSGMDKAEQWRQRGQTRPSIAGGPSMDSAVPVVSVVPQVQDIRAYIPKIVRGNVQYTRASETRIAFVDMGDKVAVHQWREPQAVHAALQLAAEKWPQGLTVSGPPAYLQQCVKLAVAQGFRLNNPELQGAIQAARVAIQAVRPVVRPVTPGQARAPTRQAKGFDHAGPEPEQGMSR